ncbi:MAG: hypothetical protein MZV64_28665 [Ignavibacteriales bacterium]|nr:hypothetical protein [Ignavibacteriales bacterium]
MAMEAAYDLLKTQTTNSDAQYMAAQLGVELSGVSALLMGVVDGSLDLTVGDATDITGLSRRSSGSRSELSYGRRRIDAERRRAHGRAHHDGLHHREPRPGAGRRRAARRIIRLRGSRPYGALTFVGGAELDTAGLDQEDPVRVC